MPAANSSYLTLVELVDYEHLVDTHGSEAASYLLKEFFNRLKSWIRPGDQSRILKSNRFLVIFKGVASDIELELATAKLARLFESPYDLFGKLTSIEVQAGFVQLDSADSNLQVAVKQARTALRQARRSNTLYQIFNEQSASRMDDERELLSALETAVELGELQLYYQPKIHAGFNSVVGAEALLRWHTKSQKVLYPSHFIEVAERHPVIRPITWWVIKSAVARLSKWPEQMSVAVNVTPTLLLDDEILAIVQDVLDIHGVTPSRLTIEVTETIMISNQQKMMAQLTRLRKLGVRISIDDFGTGHSSMTYFRDLPADELKIDKSFVIEMLKSKKDHAIVKTMIDLAHNFSLRVVAEGVENFDIAKRLAELGCDHLQGFVFDRPLPVEDFEKRYLVKALVN